VLLGLSSSPLAASLSPEVSIASTAAQHSLGCLITALMHIGAVPFQLSLAAYHLTFSLATLLSPLLPAAPFAIYDDLQGKIVVVTGASSGIGKEIALEACARGASVVLAARRLNRLQDVAAHCETLQAQARSPAGRPISTSVFQYDAQNASAAAALAQHAAEFQTRLGSSSNGIDLLVLNAGIAGPWARFEELNNTEAISRVMEVNYLGYVRALQAALPLLQPGAKVVAVSSFYGRIPAPFQSGYAAAKHALHGFANTARPELARRGVGLTVHCPGGIATDVQANFETAGAQPAELQLPALLLAPADACGRSVLDAAALGLPEAYYPLYAHLASESRQMFPEIFDPSFVGLVASYMDAGFFALAPKEGVQQTAEKPDNKA
jgi:NAD(P)-dependent dehydrogenase (short-subunit alcohol dehydrogenase family)